MSPPKPTKWTKAAVNARVRHVFRRDKAESPIVRELKRAGWHVEEVSSRGHPDLEVMRPGHPLHLLEVKSKGGRLRPAQVQYHLRLRRAGTKVPIVTTPEDALDALAGRRVRLAEDFPGGKKLAAQFAAADMEAERKRGVAPGFPASGDQDELRPVPGLPMMPQSLRALVTQAKAQLAAREVPDSSPSWAPKARVSSAYRGPKGGRHG